MWRKSDKIRQISDKIGQNFHRFGPVWQGFRQFFRVITVRSRWGREAIVKYFSTILHSFSTLLSGSPQRSTLALQRGIHCICIVDLAYICFGLQRGIVVYTLYAILVTVEFTYMI